jgi:hypothetical protein
MAIREAVCLATLPLQGEDKRTDEGNNERAWKRVTGKALELRIVARLEETLPARSKDGPTLGLHMVGVVEVTRSPPGVFGVGASGPGRRV